MLEDQDQGYIETVREAAKHCLRFHFGVGHNPAIGAREVSRHQVSVTLSAYDAQIGPSRAHPHVTRQQIAVTRVSSTACCILYDITDVVAELRDEARGYEQQSLAAIFAEQERIAQAKREEEEERQRAAQNQQPPGKPPPCTARTTAEIARIPSVTYG